MTAKQQPFAYRGYVPSLTKQLADALNDIQVEHNFEYGDEFEIALCRVLRLALPDQYGVCRGYVTAFNGEVAGDDVIIYERARFPSLRFQKHDDFSRKEYVPIEAVYAYLEAKYTITLSGKGGQSLHKAVKQVAAVKKLIGTREELKFAQLDPYVVHSTLPIKAPPHLPSIRNPPYAGIFAAAAKISASAKRTTDFATIREAVNAAKASGTPPPDLLALGPSFVVVPVLPGDGGPKLMATSFFIEGRSEYHAFDAAGNGFGIALASMMAALDWIRLDRMPWYAIVGNAVGLK